MVKLTRMKKRTLPSPGGGMMGSQLDNGKKPLRSPGDGMANSFRHPDDRRVLEPIHNSLKKKISCRRDDDSSSRRDGGVSSPSLPSSRRQESFETHSQLINSSTSVLEKNSPVVGMTIRHPIPHPNDRRVFRAP